MVFESIVADLLNRFLGDYVENLDRSQLQIGIFGGDVVLQDLILKQSALDELDLPVKTVFGHLGKLVLKIPWRNLYSAPVIASVERLFLLAVPNQEVSYDAEKEEKWKQEAKQAELQRIEEAKKLEKEKEKAKEQIPSSFAEKLAAQIIKNVQVYIHDIHIRYEDRYTCPQKPFSVGITLHNLSVHSTDENWKECIVQDDSPIFYKVLELECLAVYWNCKSRSFPENTSDQKALLQDFKNNICTKEQAPQGYSYILGPINSSAKLRINPKPEQDGSNFSIPKILLDFALEKLSVGVSKDQYQDLIELVESIDRMNRAAQYRKYRPKLSSYHGNYKQWWKFAYTCVIEEEVRRRRRNWNWNHMIAHRKMCRDYAEAYQAKLTKGNKISPEQKELLSRCEKELDLTNLVIIRQRVEVEAERILLAKQQAEKQHSWFNIHHWWGSSTKQEADTLTAAAIAKKFEDAMTPEEKAKLYRAIDYQENAAPPQYPPEFVELSAHFSLGSLQVEVRDDAYTMPRVMLADLAGVSVNVKRRPATQALRVEVAVGQFTVFGLDGGEQRAQLISSKNLAGGNTLLDVMFETNPLDGKCDQRIHVSSRPLQVVYDASTINKLADVFRPPAESNAISQLQAVAGSRLAELKEMSATGLQHVIEKHAVLDLKVDLMASYVLVPYCGTYTGNEDMLVLDLGSFKMASVTEDPALKQSVHEMHSQGTAEEEIMQTILSRSYDKFTIELQDVQILVVLAGEPWKEVIDKNTKNSVMHLLHPTTLEVHLDKCLITDDPRLPKLKVAAQLPSVSLNVTDMRIIRLMAIFASIPFPTEEEIPAPIQETGSRASSTSAVAKYLEFEGRKNKAKEDKKVPYDELVQAIDMEVKFVMKEFVMAMYNQLNMKEPQSIEGGNGDNAQKVFDFRMINLEFEMVDQTFDMTVMLRLGGLAFDLSDRVSGSVRLLDTPMAAGEQEYLLTVKYTNVDRMSPELHTRHGSVLQLVAIDFTRLTVLLHQEGLAAFLDYAQRLQVELEQSQERASHASGRVPSRPADAGKLETIAEDEEARPVAQARPSTARRSRRTAHIIETIDFKLTASMHNLELRVSCRKRPLASAALVGVDATVAVKKSYKEISAHLRNMTVTDPNPKSSHSQILSVVGEEALSARVVIFDRDEAVDSSDKVAMSVCVSMACVKVVFLNWFVTSLLNFLSSFQQAQQSIIDAAHDAAEAAKQNVQQAYTEAVRISLDIDLQAPIVIVPTNSKSSDAIMLDFGKLTIKNKFHNIPTEDKAGHVAVIDDIRLGLVDLKVARVSLDVAAGKVAKECVLLQPISLVLAVKRNLSASWYRNVPDLEVQGRLETVQITLSKEDYAMVMRVLTGNLAEGQPAQQVAPPTPESKASNTDWEGAAAKPEQRPSTLNVPPVYQAPSTTDTSADAASATVTTSLKFTFTMENLIIDLFTGGIKALDGPHSSLRSENAGLARFTLHVLSLKGHIRSDGCLAVSALLVDCMLDDTRYGREKALTRLMQRKKGAAPEPAPAPAKGGSPVRGTPPAEGSFRSMLDLTFQQKDGDSFVDVRVFGFDLVLCLDYLMKIADFFTSGMAQAQAEVAAVTAAAASTADLSPPTSAASRASRVTLSKSRTSTSVVAVTPTQQSQTGATPAKAGMMTINVHVEMPDIILVESMDTVDTNAIIMNNEISFKLRMSDTHLIITGGIKDLQLYSCCYSPDKRKDTMQQILRPCSITLAGSTPEGEGLHLDLTVTDIRLGVSPATIELLTKVQAALTASSTSQDESEEAVVDYSDLWTPKPFQETDHWFLMTEEGEDAMAVLTGEAPRVEIIEPPEKPIKTEICVISAPSIVVTVEAGIGTRTLPMIMLEMCFQGEARNWSSQLHVDSNLSMQMAYYNSYLALWEPLIEPVEVLRDGRPSHSLWELRAEVTMNSAEPVQSPASTEDVEEIPFQPPAMTIDITSKDNLELTVSKTCLEVLSNLGKAFQSAVSGQLPPRHEQTPPFMVRNDTGLTVTLMLEEGPFQVVGQPGPEGYRQAMLESGAVACLCLQSGEEPTTLSGKLSLVPVGSATTTPDRQGGAPAARDRMLAVKVRVLDRDCILKLPVVRADKRYFPLNHRGESNDPWGIVSEVTVDDSSTIVTLRSIIQVYNHFSEPVDVYYMTRRGNEVERVGTVQAGKPLNLPLYAVYTPTNELFFSVKGYTVSVIPFVWKELQNMLTHSKMLQCEPKDKKDKDPFYMKIVGELEQVYFEQTSRHTVASSCYNIYLRPAVMLKNLLPVDIVCCLAGTAKETQLKPGHRAQVATAEPGTSVIIIRIPDYLEKEWMCKHEVQANPPQFSVWTFDSYDSVQKVSMDLGIHTVHKSGSLVMSVYCPFWMLNKTGMMLSYRQTDETTNVLYHPDDFKGPILFSFRAKSFFGKKKASVKVEDGEWSDKFSLDVAGSSGTVNCKYGDTVYQIGVHIQLTYSGLTKQVTFTPYFVLINETKFLVECQEAERTADPWTKVKPGECSALWPRSANSGDRKMRLRVPEQSGMTAPFSIATVHTTLLRLNNKFGGVNVDVQITEGAAYIKFTPYEPGMAPALIINHTGEPIKLTEKGCKESRTLKPHEQVMFTWEDPAGARELQWTSPRKKEISVDLRKDTIDRMQMPDASELWWVSFLDGLQRVLLFTQDLAIATACQAAGELEPFDREIKLSVHGVGLSLVNNVARTEVMYLGIASSGIIWETCKLNSRRFKPLSVREGAALELAYQRFVQEAAVGQDTPTSHRVLVDGKLEVDFKAEEVLRPNRRKLRRTYHTGLWLQLRTSPHQTQLHAKINRLQIDNQMFDCMFPVVLAPVPPPKSVAADNVLKPFAEVSIVQRIMEHSPVQQFKYFKVLIQEFHIKLDMGFVNGLVQLFMAEEISDAQEAEQFAADLKVVEEPLQSHVSMQSSQEQKNFYDLLHFSPLKVHLSFSLSGGDSGGNQQTQTPLFLNVLLQSLGVTLTDMQDVVFKLAYLERQYTFLTQRQLVSEATAHYVGQALKQLYVLVLGLDVLGNPYGLVVGLTQGVEDLFYEPFQGAIQGPGEFAEGLVLGVRSLFGHTVGGAAGAVSRITGAMGKGLAALTFDKEYQRKRREAMQQRAPNVQTGLAQSGKGLVMGVVDGVTGVFTKPISGAREEGVEGFFKGVGKGMVGLVTRPTAGVIDFASGSLDAVKRATEVGDEVLRLRPPRYFRPDGLLRPYIREEAEGNKLLQEVDKNKYASTDTYVAHMAIGKDVVLLTDKRIMYIVHNDIFGGWQTEWGYTWDIVADPRFLEKGVFISTGESRKKVLGLFGSGESGKLLLVKEPERRQWLLTKIEEMIKK